MRLKFYMQYELEHGELSILSCIEDNHWFNLCTVSLSQSETCEAKTSNRKSSQGEEVSYSDELLSILIGPLEKYPCLSSETFQN